MMKIQTNEYDLQAKTYPNICTQKPHNDRKYKDYVYGRC